MSSILLLAVVLAPLVGAGVARVVADPRSGGRAVSVGASIAALAALGLLVVSTGQASGRAEGGDWLGLAATRPGVILLLVIAGTTAVVAAFSRRSLDDDGRAPRYFALVGIVATGSVLVVLQGSPALLLAGWLASGWALVGLIAFVSGWSAAERARRTIGRTLAIGDVALAGAVAVAAWASDGLLTGDNTAAVTQLEDTTIGGVASLHVVALLIVVAGASRSALIPFHRWLVGTLMAPTPISALVHAGLVSGAGLLLLRFADVFVRSDAAVILAFVLGVGTVLLASSMVIMRSDVKGGLAWSTVAQMAFMVIQCAAGAFSSAVFHIAGHGMYKAALFLGAGDTVSAGLRARRRTAGHPPAPPVTRAIVSALVPALAVGLAVLLIPPAVSDGGRVLIVVFAWLSLAFALSGWLARGPLAATAAILAGSAGVLVSAFAYVGGLRLVEAFVEPSLAAVPTDTVIGPTVLVGALVVLAVLAAPLGLPGRNGAELRSRWRRLVLAMTTSAPAVPFRSTGGWSAGTAPSSDPVRRAEIRADAAKAAAIIAPQWPLASFVAVNPLDGLESLGFDEATATARRWLGATTHLDLDDFRSDHELGLSTRADLDFVICSRYVDLCRREPMAIGGRAVSPVELIATDLLHGPDGQTTSTIGTRLDQLGPESIPLAELIDDVVSSWLTAFIDPPRLGPHLAGERFTAAGRRLITEDPRLRSVVGDGAAAWIGGLSDDPAAMLDAALSAMGVADGDRIDEIRAQLCHLQGWSGLAKWRNDWAHPDEARPPLAPIDVAAVRATLEAAVVAGVAWPEQPPEPRRSPDAEPLEARVDAVVQALGLAVGPADRTAIASILGEVPADARSSLWLAAQERRFDERILSMVERLDPGPTVDRPTAQLVFCIDVRSEGFRRNLESLGPVQTIGFAGFFGVPMRLRRLGWGHTEARCPVLVAPAITATEHPRPEAIGVLSGAQTGERMTGGLRGAHDEAKYGLGGPFTLAETVGWVTGPLAAARTIRPGTSEPPAEPPTRLLLDDDEILLEQRVFFAEAVLQTMGLTDRFAPLVLLCGHTSRTVNNPHATALDCGACAGASGGDNARAVAALLNSPDVRHGLTERGIVIPDDTWFLAGLHDTASDQVGLLDTADAPDGHAPAVERLRRLLEQAGERQSRDRAAVLPGPASSVRNRGVDWAQVRPEWGLAGNAAFIIGPRSMTAGLDLEGRAFLHEYDAATDPSGRVLETIMTAPLVVGHWISSQYYFSTVDPETFGAGDKLVHNPIGTTGVLSGDRGDLRVGLPLQSTHVDGRRYHQPLRLLAIIQADLERIETIIAANPILQSLTGGSWLRIAGRSHRHEPWSSRTPAGTWIASPRPFDPPSTLTPNMELT